MSLTRRATITASGLALMASAVLAAERPAGDENVIKMSPFEVSANSVEFRSWIKISSPHYLLYTDARESEAMNALRELEDVWLAAQAYFQRLAQNLPPMIVVLPTSGSDWRKIESKGNVEWRVAVSDPGERMRDLVLVQYDWQDRGLWIVRAAQGRSIARGLNLRGPFWFMRGIGKFFETVEFEGEVVKLGRQNRRTFALADDGWLAWPRFFRLTDESPEFTRDAPIHHQLEGQCAIFAHYLLTNPEPGWTERFIDWAARMDAGREPTEEEFCATFGHDLPTWQKKMERYLEGGTYRMRTLPLPKGLRDFPTAKLDLPVREMRELFVLAQVLNQKVPASEQAIDSILARGLKTDSLRELLVEACFARGRATAAQAQLQILAAGHSLNPAVYTELAGALVRQHASEFSLPVRFGDATEDIRRLCRQALEIEPRFAPAVNLLAWAEALGPAVDAENLATIDRLYQTLAGHASTSDCVAAMGVAAWRSGDSAWARKIAQTLADSPYADQDAKRVSHELLKEPGAAPPANGGAANAR